MIFLLPVKDTLNWDTVFVGGTKRFPKTKKIVVQHCDAIGISVPAVMPQRDEFLRAIRIKREHFFHYWQIGD